MSLDKTKLNKDYPLNYLFDLETTEYSDDILGIDEAGRGALAGPVVIAGVIPHYYKPIVGVTDSKKLSPAKRDVYFDKIINHPDYKYHIAIIPHTTIDSINILNATKKGMIECIDKLKDNCKHIITDSVKLSYPDKIIYPIIKADFKSASVACASILAKVTRDRILIELSDKYTGYDLNKNKGYPTKFHINALNKIGISEIHRRSYAPVKRLIQKDSQEEFL